MLIIMYKNLLTIATSVLLILGLITTQELAAQPNLISNHGFEASSSTPTGWTTTNMGGTSSVSSTKKVSGSYSFSNNNSSLTTTGYVESNSVINVPANQYLILMANYQVTSRSGNSRVMLGINGNMGSTYTPSSNNTFYFISSAIQNTTGSTATWKPRFNMYSSSGTNSRTFYWDNFIAYVSTTATVDLTAPNAPTSLAVNFSSNSANLTWQNGSDNSGGSGVQRTLVLRSTGNCTTTAPTLSDQVVYSKSGGYGESTSGTWTVIDTVNVGSTTYTDNTYSFGSNYVYAIIHEDKAYNHSSGAVVFADVTALTTPSSPTNNQTSVSPLGVSFSWPDACGATAYDIYLSTSQTDVNNESVAALVASGVTVSSYTHLTDLNSSTIYYWKAVAVSASGLKATGTSTWKFTTGEMPLSYSISRTNNITYNSIINSGNKFVWTTNSRTADDNKSETLDLTSLGFTGFNYQGNNVTALKVDINGFITFNLTSSASYNNSFSSQKQIIAPFWEDLVCQGYISSTPTATQLSLLENSIKYLVTGQQGNQILTIEWSEMEIYSNAGPSINFQVKLYEQSNKIEFVYGQMFGFNGTVNYTYSYSSGFSGNTVSSSPSAGQLISQQLANVLNFSNTNITNLSEMPDCYSAITFTPNSTAVLPSASANAITNDNCNTAITLPIQNGVQNDFCRTYSSKGATASTSIPVCTASSAGNADDDVWFKFTVVTPGLYGVKISSSGGYNGVVQLLSGNCNTLTSLYCANATGNGLIETIQTDTLVEGTYFVRVYDANSAAGGSGNFAISVYNIITPPVNDDCSGAITMAIGVPYKSASTTNATASTGISNCTASSPGVADDDVWFKFVATSTVTRLTVDGGSSFNAVLQYFSGTCTSLTNIGCVSSTGAAGVESVDLATTVGVTYFLRVYHSANGATPTTGFTVSAMPILPSCPTLTGPTNGATNINKATAQSFSWSASTVPSVGTKNYNLQISTNTLFTDTLNLPAARGLSGTSYSLPANTLANATTYYWRVIAVNANGQSEGCTYYTFSTTTSTIPSCAQGLTPEVLTTNLSTSLDLTWAAGSGSPTSYSVYLSTNQSLVSSLSTSARVATGITARSYNAPSLANNTTYYWTIVPQNASGSATGCYVANFATIPAAPANDNCSGAIAINPTSSTPVSGTTLNATQSMVGTVGFADDDVWYKFTAVSTAHNISVSADVSFNPVVEVFSGTCASLTSMQCVNTYGNGVTESARVTGLTIGQTYYVRVYDFGSTPPTSLIFNIRINDVDLGVENFVSPSNNNCGNTTVKVALKNFGVADVNLATNPVTITSTVLSPANVTTNFSSVIVNSGIITAGNTLEVTITTNYQVVSAGNYTYSATATTVGDINEFNNSVTSTLQQIELPNPYILSGSGTYCLASSGVMFTLSGSEVGTSYQLYQSQTAISDLVSGTGSAISFPNVRESGAYRVVAQSQATGCQSYMSASSVVTVTPLWLGINTNWNNTANWCGGVIPASNANIIISGSAVFMPTLPSNIVVNNLELTESNKTIELNGKTLTINGKIAGAGAVKGSTTSSIIVNGSGDMGVLKMDQTTNGVTNALQNLTINVGSTKTNDSIVIGNALNLVGTLALNNGKLNANGNLTLVSSATGTARVAAIANTADIIGNVVSQRYVPSVVRRYRMISPNTSSFTFNDIKDDMFVTGSGGATNGFDVSNPNSASIYTYRESTTGGRGWVAVTNINQTLNPSQGAIVFVRGDRTLPAPQWYTAPYVTQNQVTIDFVGPVNKGTFAPTITYTNTGFIDDDGWNLIGNPYPSQIDWSLVTKSNISPFVYVLDPSTNAYVANDGTTAIASGQGFFVKAIANSPSVTFNESNKTSGTASSLFKTGNVNPFKLSVVMDSITSDYAVLRVRDGASVGVDQMEDALKLTNSTFNFGYKIGTSKIQINTVPTFTAVADTFVLFAVGPAKSYVLTAANFGEIPDTKTVLLKDLFTNTTVDLRLNNTYAFNITSSGLSQGNRFLLIITNQSALPVEFIEIKANVASNNTDIDVKWATATEVNNDRFVVEKSYDNKTFTAVGTVKGALNSKVRINYNFVDAFAAKQALNTGIDKVYYRVNQVDVSGQNKYSDAVVVYLNQSNNVDGVSINLFPNPAKNVVFIEQTSQHTLGEILIIDITGKLVKTQTENGFETSIDISDLHSGIYFVKCNNSKTYKLIVE